MKIGYIGGVKNGKHVNKLSGIKKYDLDWEVKADRPSDAAPQGGFQTAVLLNISPGYDTYNLKLLKKNGEVKFFYVLDGMGRDDIAAMLEACWEISDTIGYDFD